MATTKTQQGMVFLKEGATAPAAAPAADHPPGYFVPLRPGKGGESETDQSTCVSSEEAVFGGKRNMYPAKESIARTGGLKRPTNLNTHSDNLSPDITCKGVRVTLDNNSMWKEFFSCKTEMILTKEGSRMFPYCRFHISGLQPATKYCLIMDIQPLDLTQYKWTGDSWQVSRKAECHIKSQPFSHPESPATGQHWMQSPVSFYRLKLTNNISDQDGNIILHPMHRYLPRLHLVQTDKAVEDITLNGPSVLTFCFPQTEFLAVTAYQNPQFAQLKVNYNPFAKGLREDGSNSWGLKLKATSTKQLNKDEGRRITEQHPVRKNLKYLLASHKPRSSKAGDSKSTGPKDLQNNSTINNNQSAATIPGESLRSNSRPAQKLISELIREAHVSLQRCSVEQLGINHSTSLRGAQTNTRTTTLSEGKEQNVVKKDNISVEAPMRKREAVEMKKEMKEKDDGYHLNSSKAIIKTDFAAASPGPHNSFELSDNQCHSDSPSDAVKQHKRPARLPLPALALFLKRHSIKSKKTESKPDPPPPAPPSEAISEYRSSAATSDNTFVAESIIQDCTLAHTDLHQNKMVLNIAEQADDTTQPPSSPSCLGTVAGADLVGPETDDPFVSIPESSGLEPTVPDGTPELPNLDRPFCTFGTSASTLTTCATSNASSNLSPLLNTMLLDPNSPETPTESSALPSDSGTLRTESSLPDPECSSFDFEPLSPASSPEPLPPLPASLAFELDTSALEATSSVGPPEDLLLNENSSVFKWHTVLPPSESDRDSFPTFQPTPQAPLLSVTPPLLPCQSEPQSLNTSTSMPPTDPTVSFQEGEQLLPFPAELSSLALQLTLSPTFSSLDEDELSPTPSLSDFVHFFSTDVETGVGGTFSNTVAVPCPPPSLAEAPPTSLQVSPVSASKPCKRKKSCRWTKLSRLGMEQRIDDYKTIQPNLEEVEEQLFISFTSKEALKMHIADSSEGLDHQTETTPEDQQTAEAHENSNSESLEETIAALENSLLRDLKLMKYRQVIHPVLQEVGLKMTLLDPALSIDLQYLGVHLPIPPPGVGVEPLARTLPSSPGNALGVSSAFVSRTGKTTDVTQIKGWREKFTVSEAVLTPASSIPEAGPSSEPQKKNLSAFCSDMLDEYLENEGKLIDERAASFSQPPFETPAYELPTKSTSYVWTLDHILKKQTAGSPASDLISGFIPPSKRPRLKETKMCSRAEKKHKGRKPNKPSPELAAAPVSESSPTVPTQSSLQTTVAPHQTIQPSVQPTFKTKRKPRTLSQTLSSARLMLDDLAPLESDSELGQTSGQREDACKKAGRPMMTRGLMRQKALEDGVVWEGRVRTSITEERAAVALTSLFTLTGFVRENPTAPIQLAQARASPCLNEFCRLGCICSSLSHSSRNSHCGRPPCMFGCSCLKQKVVLLKNLDSSDSSSTSHYGHIKKRKRRKRMKMAYVLKEADSVSQPADRVQTLWKRDGADSDPEPVHIPDVALPFGPTVGRENHSSCARVRGYRGWIQKHKEASKGESLARDKAAQLKFLKQRDLTLKETKANISSPHLDEAVQPLPSKLPPSPPEEPTPKPSKRLFIVADCKWASDTDQSFVLKKLCEAMAQDKLDQPFSIRKYLISPIDQTVEGSGADRCIQYRVRISTSKLKRENPKTVKLTRKRRAIKAAAQQRQQDHLRQATVEEEPPQDRLKEVEMVASLGDWQKDMIKEAESPEDWQKEVIKEAESPEDWQKEVIKEAESPEDWQKEVIKEAESPEDWQKEVIKEAESLEDWQKEVIKEAESPEDWQKEVIKEAESLEDWQKEVEEGDIEQEEEACTGYQVDYGQNGSGEEMKSLKKRKGSIALPFLTGVSPAGFLSADRKQPGGTDHMIQVNGKLYPLAKIQLGRMGALHPANRLAAYLTGRVGSNRQQEASPPSFSSPCNPAQSSGRTPQTTSSASSVLSSSAAVTTTVTTTPVRPEPSVTPLIPTTSPTESQPTGSVGQPVNLSLGSAPHKGSQVLLFQVPGPHKTDPLSPNPPQILAPPSTRQKMVLQLVRTATGMQYYRKPNGKLVQLIPITQLRPVNSKPPIQRGLPSPPSSSPTVLCTSGFQTPTVTVVNRQQPPLTTSSSSPSSGSSPSSLFSSVSTYLLSSSVLSSSSSVSVPHVAVPLHQGSLSFAKKGTYTLKIPPANTDSVCSYTLQPTLSTTEMNQPSMNQGSELVVKTTTVNAASLRTEGMGVQHKPASPQIYPTSLVPMETPIPRGLIPPASNLPADALSHEQELALDPVDLDIICVDDETGLTTETQTAEVVNLMSSSDTDNSSDFRESEGEEKPPFTKKKRYLHNVHEKNRRGQLQQKFSALREVVHTEEKMSKISILNRAVKVIQELRWTHRALKKKTRRLRRRRDEYLSVLAPSAELTSGDGMEKFIEVSSNEENVTDTESTWTTPTNGAASAGELPTASPLSWCRAGEEEETRTSPSEKLEEAERGPGSTMSSSQGKHEMEALSSALNTTNSSEMLLLDQTPREIQTLQREMESLKTPLDHIKTSEPISNKSGGSQNTCQHPSSKQETEVHQAASQLQARGGASTTPPAEDTEDHIVSTSFCLQRRLQTPPTCEVGPPTPAAQLQPPIQSAPQVETSAPAHPHVSLNAPGQRKRPKTLPNILSRNKNPVGSSCLYTGASEGIPTRSALQQSSLEETKAWTGLSASERETMASNNLLHLVQPGPAQQHTPPLHHQLVPTGSPPLVVSGESDLIRDQDQPPSQTLRPSKSPGPSTDHLSDVQPGGPPVLDTRSDPNNKSLSSLLNEISFLNQQTVAMETSAGTPSPLKQSSEGSTVLGVAEEQRHAPHLDCQVVRLNGHAETRQEGGQPGPAADNTKEGVLAPPPLLHMKLGGAKVPSLPSSEGAAMGGAEGGRGSGDVAWRPMPRLVPLGLRGNSPS
ncbi:MAX dimerization protein MGA a isoform 3-T3 [Odontesthes bonariensis]|uniref:MAX dimerization protein MGA a isoform X3 n=1 Tax=Odontesthes bonariensis TaxID=219752 RepID=UPI003F584AAD